MELFFNLANEFISKNGFPIFVCLILLWRDDHRHHENVNAIRELTDTVNRKRCGRR